jgi:hypothetical protein
MDAKDLREALNVGDANRSEGGNAQKQETILAVAGMHLMKKEWSA